MRLFHNIVSDFRAYRNNYSFQGFWIMLVYRLGRWQFCLESKFLRFPFMALYSFLFKLIEMFTKAHISCEAEIGRDFIIDHYGDILISPKVRIGSGCRIRQEVVVGYKDDMFLDAVPTIGSYVDIGAGAKLLGKIKIGNNVKIGANAVVIHDVPDNCTAVGVPARII